MTGLIRKFNGGTAARIGRCMGLAECCHIQVEASPQATRVFADAPQAAARLHVSRGHGGIVYETFDRDGETHFIKEVTGAGQVRAWRQNWYARTGPHGGRQPVALKYPEIILDEVSRQAEWTINMLRRIAPNILPP